MKKQTNINVICGIIKQNSSKTIMLNRQSYLLIQKKKEVNKDQEVNAVIKKQ